MVVAIVKLLKWNLGIVGILRPAILSFIERFSSLWRLNCTSVVEKGPQSVWL